MVDSRVIPVSANGCGIVIVYCRWHHGCGSHDNVCNPCQKESMGPVRILQMADATRYRTMTTEELRAAFLIDDLFHPGQIGLTYIDLDRTVIGSAVPTGEP